jgi:hypothetical protein
LGVDGDGERYGVLPAAALVSSEIGTVRVVCCGVCSTFTEFFGERFRSLRSENARC